MADNLSKTEWDAGAEVSSDDIGGIHYPRVKLTWGADGTANDIADTPTAALPVKIASEGAVVSTTQTPLGISGSWTSTHFDSSVSGAYVTGLYYADQGGTHYVEESPDNTTWDIVHQDTYVATEIMLETHLAHSRYIRHRFVNGATGQTVFRGTAIQRHDGFPDVMGIDDRYNIIKGDKTHNTSAPTAEAHEVIGAVAKAAAPTYTEGAVVMPRVTLSGDQAVTLDGESVVVTNAGTFAVQAAATLAAETTKVIGTVNVAAAQTIAVTNAGTFATQAAVAGDVAHDGADSGNPAKMGAKAISSLEAQTLVVANDRTNLYADLDGVQITKTLTTFADILADRVADTAGTSAAFTNHGAGGAGVRNYVTTIAVFNSSATDAFVDIRDGTAGAIIFTIPAPKGGGAVITLPVPLRQPTANTALAYDVSAAITTMYISIVGFQSKAG